MEAFTGESETDVTYGEAVARSLKNTCEFWTVYRPPVAWPGCQLPACDALAPADETPNRHRHALKAMLMMFPGSLLRAAAANRIPVQTICVTDFAHLPLLVVPPCSRSQPHPGARAGGGGGPASHPLHRPLCRQECRKLVCREFVCQSNASAAAPQPLLCRCRLGCAVYCLQRAHHLCIPGCLVLRPDKLPMVLPLTRPACTFKQ